MTEVAIEKKCGTCGRAYNNEQDVLRYGTCWRICNRGSLWFNCACDSTLMVPAGRCAWFSPDKVMQGEARSVFNALPELKRLPKVASSVMELQQLIENENVTSHQLAAAAKREPVLAGNILKMANNFKFSSRTAQIASLDHAISYVGLKVLREMIVASALQSFTSDCKIFDPEQFWREAMTVGRIAEHLAREFCPDIIADDAYVAGCLCNVGKIVMSILYPEATDEIIANERDPSVLRCWVQSERKMGLPGHRVLGEIGASFWGMPDFVCKASANHHMMPVGGDRRSITIGELTSFANQLAHWLHLDPHLIDMPLLLKIAAKFGFSTESILETYVDKISFLRESVG